MVKKDITEYLEFDDPALFMAYINRHPKKRNKYNAQKVTADGYTFDSGAEYRRYLYLKSEQDAGRIKSLQVHPKFKITDAYQTADCKMKPAKYYAADFIYFDVDGAKTVVEDVKGGKATQTDLFKLKWALMHNIYDYELRIIES